MVSYWWTVAVVRRPCASRRRILVNCGFFFALFLCADLLWTSAFNFLVDILVVLVLYWDVTLVTWLETPTFFSRPMNYIHKKMLLYTTQCLWCIELVQTVRNVCLVLFAFCYRIDGGIKLKSSQWCWMYVVPPTKCLPDLHSFSLIKLKCVCF